MTVLLVDQLSYAVESQREYTGNGYLKVPGRVARTGIQVYRADELGLTDRKPEERVKVFRPPEEVFSDESLKSYEHTDVTNDHPSNMVTADSFKDVAVGHAASPAYQQGEYVVVDLIVKDKAAIKSIEDGKAALSAGYGAEYVYEPGQTADGEDYEFVQRNIRINHIALVDKARAGPAARLFDQDGGTSMGKIVTLDKAAGSTVEVADESTAKLIQQTIDGLNQRASDAEAKAAEEESEKDKAKAEADRMKEKNEELEDKASDKAINDRVSAVLDAQGKARQLAGDGFTCDSVDPMAIKREALKVSRPTVDWDDKNDAYVEAAWDLQLNESDEERSRRSHDNLGADLRGLPAHDGKPKDGTAAYTQFLSGNGGGTH